MEPEAATPHDQGVAPAGKGDKQEPDSADVLSATTKPPKQKRSTHQTHSGGGESGHKSTHAPATGAGEVSSSPPQSPVGPSHHDHGGHRADDGMSETQQRTVRSSAVLYQQYQSLYEKFKVLDEKYGTLKKAMNEVLWEVLPKYTEDYNQLPALDKTIDDSHIHSSSGSELAGKYAVMEKIGEGRFAQVRNCRTVRAEDEDEEDAEARVESPMCIKTLNKAMIKDARRGRRVHQEVFALKTLRHPNVIVLYDVIHTKEHVHIITERLEKDLFDYIHRRHGMSEGDMFVLVWQIMAGILHCHSKGIAHRDLKPENILVNYRHSKTPVVKVCDFGLSLEQKEPLMEVEMVGSPGFLPPEILAPGWYDPMRGDVWSIGCILLEMVTDADYFKKVWMKPYDHLSEPRVFQERMTASLQRLSTDMRLKLTDGLCDLLFGMLTLDFRERPHLMELREQQWVQNNARRYNMALHEPEQSDVLLQPPSLERSPSEYSVVSSVTVSSVLSPKVLNRSTSNTTFTEKLRTRVDAFTTKKTFRIRPPDMINTGSDTGTTTSSQVDDSVGSNDAGADEHDQAGNSGHTSGEGGEEEGANGGPGQLGANGQLQHLKTAASSSPKTPKRQGVKPPSFFSRGKAAVSTTPLTSSY